MLLVSGESAVKSKIPLRAFDDGTVRHDTRVTHAARKRADFDLALLE